MTTVIDSAMRKNQPPIPGLQELVKARANVDTKQATLQQQLKDLQDRVIRLELEVSLLRILVENPKGDK